MPWEKSDVKNHKQGLTDAQEEQWVEVANSALKKCMDEGGSEDTCAVSAIKQANSVVEEKAEPDKTELETRNYEEIRTIGKTRMVEGYAIVFNSLSKDLGGFKEVIKPEAIEGVIERSDVLALVNHDMNKGVLARSTNGKGSLELSVDKKGVQYRFTAPDTALGNELIEGIKRGDIRTSSFSFTVDRDGQQWDTRSKPAIRTVTKFANIFDVSAVYREAYDNTSVALRSLEQIEGTTVTTAPEFEGKDLSATMTIEVNEGETRTKVLTDETNDKTVIDEPVTDPMPETEKVETKAAAEPSKPDIQSTNLKNTKMTLQELRDARAAALEENGKIYDAKTAENRTMTEKEEAITALNNQRVKEYDLQIETESRKTGKGAFVGGGPYIIIGQEKEPFSLIKAIRAEMDHKVMPDAARELNSIGQQQFRSQTMHTAEGTIVLPNYATPIIGRPEMRANILAQTATAGQEIVQEDKKAILPPLVDNLIFSQAGITYMPGLVGDVSIPAYAGTTVAWKDEVETAADGGGAFTEVTFAPKKLTGYIDVSKTFLAQDGVGAERLLMNNIANACARKLEATILGPATLSSRFPSGIGYKLDVANGGGVAVLTGATITYAALVGLETTVNTANAAAGNLAYVTNGTARGLLKTIDIGTTNDTAEMIMMGNQMNGYPVLVTNSIVSTYGAGGDGNAVFFGNWADLVVAQWGGYDITVDPYSKAVTNQVRIVINVYLDAKGLRGSTGAGATLDEYAYSFSALSIK